MIKNIIFDFGNVLLDINMQYAERELSRLAGPEQMDRAMDHLRKQNVFELYETGGLSTPEFVDAIRYAYDPPLASEQVAAAWNAIFIGMPPERFDMLLNLRRQYKVFLLSNINELHADWIDAYMLREHGISDFQTRYFDGVYYSHLIRLRKPDRDIYEYVLADAEIKPEESVFFDDLPQNIEGARQAGLHAVWHEPGSEIIQRMRPYIES